MRIGSQNAEIVNHSTVTSSTPKTTTKEVELVVQDVQEVKSKIVQGQSQADNANAQGESKDAFIKEQLQQAVDVMNDLIDVQQKSSKFVFHEGLDKYYVKLVDSKTEEVIKEIPPEKLLDAFYEMQKLTGMIVDEKI